MIGHVVQGRYRAYLVDDGYYLLNVVRYLALNPVVADQVSRPEDWPWSSYRCAMGLAPVPPFLDLTATLEALQTDDAVEGRRRLAAFVASGEPVHGWCEVMFGSERLAVRRGSRYVLVWPSCWRMWSGVRNWTGRFGVAFEEHGYTLREIGEHLGRPPATVWSWVHRARRPATCAVPDDPAWND